MGRLPFNPDRLPRPKSDGAGRGGRPMTVSEAAGIIRQALADASGAKLRVVGQVSNFSERSHWFFSLKDEQATLRCVCFDTLFDMIHQVICINVS